MRKHYAIVIRLLPLFLLLLSGITSVSQAQTLVWGKRVGGTGNDNATSIAVDAAGNSYVTGIFSGTAAVDFDPSPTGMASLTSLGEVDAFIAKYDPAGNYLWAKPLAGSENSESGFGYNIAVDGNGNCYITGSFSGTVDFNPDPTIDYSLTFDEDSPTMILAKYDSNGNLVWVVNSGTGANGASLALDGSTNIFVTGSFSGTVTFGTSNPVTLTATGQNDVFIAKYSPLGELTWIQSVGGTGSTSGTDLGVDAGGNVYVRGAFYSSTDFDPTAGTNVLNPANGARFLTKYSAAGNYQWAINLPNRTNLFIDFYGLKVDNAGNSYVTGAFSGTADFDPSPAVVSLSAVGSTSTYLAKYDTDGHYNWAVQIGGNQGVFGLDMEVDAAGNSYATGVFSGTADFDPSTTAVASLSTAGTALFLAKYTSTGGYIQANKIDNADLTLYRLALDGRANWYITAPFSNTIDVDPSAAVTTLTSAGLNDMFIAKYTDCQSITAQPAASSAVCAGSSVTVSVGVSSTVSGYQWFHNGTALSGQTTATLNLANVQAADAGNYVVVVTNACISLTSTSFSLVVGSGIIHVTESGSGLQNGSSWANSLPGSALQFAIDQAAGCASGQVWVARGTYKPTSTTARDVAFRMLTNVPIYGGFLGSETALSGRPNVNPVTGQPSSSTLSGEIGDPNSLTDNSYNIFQNNISSHNALLDGFVLTGAYNYGDLGNGGAIFNFGNTINVNNCLFINNASDNLGGGIANRFISVPPSTTSLITNCVFRNNTAISGGALFLQPPSSVTIVFKLINNIFESNSAQVGGAIAGSNPGGTNRLNLEIINCLFRNNTATNGGALIYSTLGNNGARGRVALVNCGFLNNSATEQGGVLYARHIAASALNLNLSVTNSSFQGNTAATGQIMSSTASAGVASLITLTNNVLTNNGPAPALYVPALTVVSNNNLFDPGSMTVGQLVSGPGNLTTTVSPYASTTGLELAACSPAINAGDNSATGLTGITTDLAGSPRRYQNGIVDMGAYEFQGVSLPASFSVLSSAITTCAVSPTITLSGSETGVSYQLQRDGQNAGSVIPGTGSTITFGPQSLTGTYTVLATGANSCTALMTGSVLVATPASVSISPSSGTLSCSNQAVSLSAIGDGTVLWSTGASTSVISATSAGTYTVSLTSTNSCTATASVVVSGTVLRAATVTTDGPVGCGRSSAQITIQAVGATSFTLLGPSGFSAVNGTGVFSVTVGGSYTGVAAQSGGCVVSGEVVVGSGGIPPSASDFRASGVLGTGSCTVRLLGTGTGNAFVMTGPRGYVYSNVYRNAATYPIEGRDVRLPGMYTLTVYSGDCTTTYTTVVTGTACSSGQ